jgi:nitrite reductase (NADH) large subunit
LLADGRRIPADFVVLAVGIRPNVDLARTARLDVNRGILVGDDMGTSDPDIHAVGECIEHNGQVFGLVAPIWDQAKVCGARLAGDAAAVYVPSPVFTSLKITGVDVFSAGRLAAADAADEEITLHDAKRGLYKKVILRDDRIVGSVLYGSVADGPWYVQLMRDRADVCSIRDRIVFGRAFAAQASAALPRVDVAATAETAAAAGRLWQAA